MIAFGQALPRNGRKESSCKRGFAQVLFSGYTTPASPSRTMNPILRLLAVLFCVVPLLAGAQQPKLHLKFDGNLSDSSAAGIITGVQPSPTFSVTYSTDRFNQASRAIVFPGAGSVSLQLLAAAQLGDSNAALGLRGAPGGSSSFTLAAWVYFSGVGNGQGYSTVFGNLGSGAGTLHAGLGLNSDKTHFGFDGNNDLNGITTTLITNQWFHFAFVYDAATQQQRIYINGIPEAIRNGAVNTLKAADLLLGNWGGVSDATNDLKGRLDDVLVYDAALKVDQIQALSANVSPTNLPTPGTYSPPKLPGIAGGAGTWGVREIKGYALSAFPYGTLVGADRIARNYAVQASGTKVDYQAATINLIDPGFGTSFNFGNDVAFNTNTAADDNNLLVVAKCAVRIAEEDDYTLSFRGDDGGRLRVLGQHFTSSTRLGTANNIDPAHHGDGIYFINSAADSHTLGVVHLRPGDHNLELLYWESTGSSSIEVSAARGARNSFDSSFKLIGDVANGGLPIVPDPDNVTLTANGSSAVFVHAGSPTSFSLGWSSLTAPSSITIDQGIGTVAQNGSMTIAAPAQTTVYTLTATFGTTVITRQVTVYVDAPPALTFFADRPVTISGRSVRLNWVALGSNTLVLTYGGNTVDVTGLSRFDVVPTADETYTLSATNVAGATTRTVTIQAGAGPVIRSFSVADSAPLFGAETALSWNVDNATSLSIDQGVGAVSGATGLVAIEPHLTTTYTLTATNFYGSVTASTLVTQAVPIGVTVEGFTVRKVSASVAFPFPNQGYLETADNLLAGQNAIAASDVTVTGVQTINYSNGAEGDFQTGNLDFPGGGGGDHFAVRATATLVVNTPGEYTFVINSDDGARLRIDGQDVIVDDGTHSPSASSGRVTLTKPTAQLELVHYDTTGGSEVELGWIRPSLQWQLLTTIIPAAPVVRGQLLLSEFSAENEQTILDEDGAAPDWIEIWNSTNSPINLTGYHLTDRQTGSNAWTFPAWVLNPNEFLIVFASGKDRKPAQVVVGKDNLGTPAQPRLHTNFKIEKSGGYLALTRTNGAGGFESVTQFSSYPPQRADVSYGSSDAEGYIGYMETPTPGQPNAASVAGFVEKLQFSHARGRYTAPFNLAISTPTPGASIRYTTDGTTPTRNLGSIYTGPIPINGTRVVRTFAYRQGWKSTDVETQSYLFIDDIVNQSPSTATDLGFPLGPIAPRAQKLRYGMTLGNVTAGGGNLQALKTALASSPTVCLTTEVPNLMHPATGIYANSDKHGLFWERPASLEYIDAAGISQFQIDCGVRTRGGFSRSPDNPKHGFHLYFRGSLYDGDLKYRLFGTGGASEFSQIDMRAEQNYSWAFQNDSKNTLMREEWSRVTQRDMGQPYARTGYFHLYINGIYWGIYNWEERTEASFGKTYLGGKKDNQDVVKSAGSSGGYNTEMTDGNFAAWHNLYQQAITLKNEATEAARTSRYLRMQGLGVDGRREATYPVLLDVDNLIDYMLVVFYDGSFDSPMSTFLNEASNNWFGVRDRQGSRGFAFFAHDHEHGMDSNVQSYNRVGPWGDPNATGNNWNQTWTTSQYRSRERLTNGIFVKSNPQYLHELLAFSAEYRQRFADRVQRHFFNGGALTTAKALARLGGLATEVNAVIHAEAARWGSASLNRNSWNTARTTVENFINNGGTIQSGQVTFPAQPRTSLVVEQLRGYQDPVGTGKALFPPATLSAPTFSGVFGGPVASPHTFQIANPNAQGTLYYTVNDQDPRPIGGGSPIASAIAGNSSTPITLTNTATVRARIYVPATQLWSALTEAEYLVGVLASSTNLAITKIHYNPDGPDDLSEFLEFMNIGSGPIDLTNVRGMLGVQFTFSSGYLLGVGERTLIVRDQAFFTTTYGAEAPARVAGTFLNGSSLDNNGERLQVVDALGNVIRDFSYNDKAPWPVAADGSGPCLVLLKPLTNPNHGIGTNWRASATAGGNPGASDALAYGTWATLHGIVDPSGDDDSDGWKNLAEYSLGTNPKSSLNGSAPVAGEGSFAVGATAEKYLTLTFQRVIGRDDALLTVEASSGLTDWSPAVLTASPTFNGDGTETLVYRYPQPKGVDAGQFLRLRMTLLP